MKFPAEPVVIDRETIERRGAFTFEEWKALFHLPNRVAVMRINETDYYMRTPYGVPRSYIVKLRGSLDALEKFMSCWGLTKVVAMLMADGRAPAKGALLAPVERISAVRIALEDLENRTPAGPQDGFVSQAALAKALGWEIKAVNKLVAAGDIPLGVPVEHYVHRIATDPSSLELVRRTPGAEFIGSGILEPSKTCQES
jgi:hypothetical protein